MTTVNTPGTAPLPTEVRYLEPATCRIHLGPLDTLQVTVEDEPTYAGVIAVYLFPVAHARRYISLLHQTGDDQPDIEIGIIRDLDTFPADQAQLVQNALDQRYFIHTITRIITIGWKFGFVAFEVETDKGPAEFLMRWQHDRAANYGRNGKVLIDVNENRYLIPDLEQLPPREQQAFTRIIYW